MRNRWLASILYCGVVVLGSCATIPPVTVRSTLPRGSEVAVVMFRDCVIAGQEDCDGSGLSAGSIFARVFSERPGWRAVPISRPVSPREPLDDGAAVAFAKGKGFRYVLNGDVEDYYRVAPMTFRTERAGVSVRLLNTENGDILAFFSHRMNSQSNLTTPDAMIEKFASRVRDAAIPVVESQNSSK